MLSSLLLLFLLHSVVWAVHYEDIKNVHILSHKNFYSTISLGNWLVIFYRKSCGHCISYSTTFEEFAISVTNWGWAVRLGAVDCENRANSNLCADHYIDSVPKLLYFSSGTKKGKDVSRGNSENLRSSLASLIAESKTFGHLTNNGSDNNKLVVISNSSLLNSLIILDNTQPIGRPIIGVIDNKSSKVVVQDPNSGIILASGTYKDVQKELQKFAVTRESDPYTTISPEPTTAFQLNTIKKLLPVYAVDIFRSLGKLLYLDVSARKVIDGHALEALKEFIHMLYTLLPASEEYLSHLNRLQRWVSTKSSFTGHEWATFLNHSQFPMYEGSYIGCNGSKPYYRGYPCGLWTLFHALTVQQYLVSQTKPDLPPDFVLHAMNRFIPRFFSCTLCAFHFAANSVNIARPGEPLLPENRENPEPHEFTFNSSIVKVLPKSPHSSREAVIWLNIVHNLVNKRLAGEATEDPTAPKVQFPSIHFCPACWSLNEGVLELGKKSETEEALFQFLIDHYRYSSWNFTQLPTEFVAKPRYYNPEQNASDLTTIWVISVVLTILAAVILLVGFRLLCRRHFKPRRQGNTYTAGIHSTV